MVFHLNGRPFLHFHEEPEGIFADVLLVKGRVHLPVSTESEQSELLEQIDHALSSLDSRVRDQERQNRGGPRRRARWIFRGRRSASD